ncbi:MAG: MmgE/PrpD family protein, partial [Chloroflexota bacterium]
MAPVTETIAQRLGKYIVQLEYGALPKAVVEETKAALLDQLGCQLIGSTLHWNRVVHDYVAGFEGRGESTIVNYGTRALAHDAAYANGTFGQGAELDQSFDRAGGHAGAVTCPVAMALGEKQHADGKAFLTSIVAGYDVA